MKTKSIFAVFALAGCVSTSSAPPSWQEPIAAMRQLPTRGNPISFGASIAGADSQALALVLVDAVAAHHQLDPRVAIFVFHYPIDMVRDTGVPGIGPGGVLAPIATSYRDPENRLIVLSWWGRERHPLNLGSWGLGDAAWEISHYVAGTDDDDKPIK